ncbi:GFA family protein [Asticcacaulis sp. EMRT-3]|uniref:GFA family protein n=1 Tax=Asticcacaulis sp. EMRT-3 TaxID=3040349 RepID=UPI0024AF7730|nr:GFA family protein [Asticcacaulis sp. EMRT-3]MDI7773952.1 GFA family protein [Asticcacaulis sp. EMRT-3]
MRKIHKGGCSCGAVRFVITGPLGRASVCHCRMCQKAFGNVFAPLVSIIDGSLVWTKAEPARFQSSNLVKRGFCPACGTPLSYEAPDGLAVAIGAFDHPADIVPDIQFGTEARIGWLDHLNDWPARDTLDDIEAAPFLSDLISYQYPDEA